jgi:hypothetical protein
MPKLTIEVDANLYTAEVPMGATLGQFLNQVGLELSAETLLCDGYRVMAPSLELAFRHHGARLLTEIPREFVQEVHALTPESLLVSAER